MRSISANLPAFIRNGRFPDGGQVSVLTTEESHALDEETLNRFPAASSEGIDWDAAPFRSRGWWFENELGWPGELSDVLSPFLTGDGRTAVLWGIAELPTIVLRTTVAIEHAEDIMAAHPAFWLHPLGSDTLVECLVDGQVTVAEIP